MPIPLSIIWHQHQPYYKDLASGEMALPWVRLHGIKDYYGMARLLSEFPGMRCTINLVPSMISQLIDYVEKDATDPFLRRTVLNADSLSADDVYFILDHFFMAQWDRMIRVHPRYRQLLELRRFNRRPASSAAENFTAQDLRDLQVWFNLVWFHPVSFEESEALKQLLLKGRDFTEQDKVCLLQEQKRVLARVIPLHKELAARRQIELSTTPFYHPILPLLCDMRSCQTAMPRNPLPSGHISLADDAEMQIKKAVEYHHQVFGTAPQGMWPSEGSVSPAVVPLIARHGIQWIATDEEILSHSLGTRLRGGFGKLERPDLLYRPWRYELQGAKLNVLFRDHHLSDLVAFQYQSWDGAAAAEDFMLRVQAAGQQAPAGGETLVTVILDGENCWEHFPDQGVQFLRTLYGKLEHAQSNVLPVRVSDFLGAHPPQRHLENLFPGSWINHDFYIWVGHAEDRRAWEYVYRVREDLLAAAQLRARQSTPNDDMALAHAWEELYIAEGSDWYWWYGDDHSSGNDDAFDKLFRTHLKNVYKFLGQPSPFFLNVPVKGGAHAGRYTSPSACLHVRVDGRCTSYFEWLGAGRYRADKEGGVMTAGHKSLLDQIYFGYDNTHLCVRIDLHDEPVLTPLKKDSFVRAHLVGKVTLNFPDLKLHLHIDPAHPKNVVCDGAWKLGDGIKIDAAWDEILEARIPFAALGVKEGEELSFFVEAHERDRAPERYPRSCALQFAIPPANVHEHEWMA